MGTDHDKLFLPLGQEELGKKALATASQSSLDQIYVLCGMETVSKWGNAQMGCAEAIGVEQSAKGQSESIKRGVQQAIRDGAQAVMILLADQPFVTLDWIDRLIGEFERGESEFVASLYNGHPRPPAIFSQTLFHDLLQLEGDRGAKEIFWRERHRGRLIKSDDPKLFFDVDTKEDYRKVQNDLKHG